MCLNGKHKTKQTLGVKIHEHNISITECYLTILVNLTVYIIYAIHTELWHFVQNIYMRGSMCMGSFNLKWAGSQIFSQHKFKIVTIGRIIGKRQYIIIYD